MPFGRCREAHPATDPECSAAEFAEVDGKPPPVQRLQSVLGVASHGRSVVLQSDPLIVLKWIDPRSEPHGDGF